MFRKSSFFIIPSVLLNVILLWWFAKSAGNVCIALSTISSDTDVDFEKACDKLALKYLDKDSAVFASSNDVCSCFVFDGGRFPFFIGGYSEQFLQDDADGAMSKYSVRYGSAVVDWKQDSSGKCYAVRARVRGKYWMDARGDGEWKEASNCDSDDLKAVEDSDRIGPCSAAEGESASGTESAGR